MSEKSAKKGHQRRAVNYQIQKKYSSLVAVSVFLYSLLVFGLAMAAPLVFASLKLGTTPFAEREFIVLTETTWPAVVAFVLGGLVLSFYLAQRIGGPLYRVERTLETIAKGDLDERIFFRKSDQLDALETLFNETIGGFDSAVRDVRAGQSQLHDNLEAALRAVRDGDDTEAAVDRLESALEASRSIEQAVAEYRVSKDDA